VDHSEILDWCQTFNGVSTSLRVYKLVCEDTVEDSLSIQALGLQGSSTRNSINQQNQISAKSAHNLENDHLQNHEPICKIKKHALEALFNTHFAGDNGVLSGKKVGKRQLLKRYLKIPRSLPNLIGFGRTRWKMMLRRIQDMLEILAVS
jgi:hypothetical protein